MGMNEDELRDLLNDPIFDITEEEKSLFSFPDALHVKAKREKAEYVAQRVVCEDFYKYEPLFKKVHAELKAGKRSLVKYNVKALKEKTFYIVSGVMVYLESIMLDEDTKRHHPDGRTHLIYENGMESDIKVHSLAKNVYSDGFVVTECKDTDQQAFDSSFNITDEDKQTGWIYVLKSLSTHEDIAREKDLFKIGYSTVPVQERIKNCEYEPTYLMDQVEVVATWKTYNMNTQKFEALLHQFLSAVRYRVKVYDMAGEPHDPQEWFIVPLPIIKTIVNYIISGDIVNYKYNATLQLLEEIEKVESALESPKLDTSRWAILSLIIKDVYFRQILSGEKVIEYRELKQSTQGKYTLLDKQTNTRYLKRFDALRLFVGYHKDRDTALVEVVDTKYIPETGIIEYHLGKVLEVTVRG